MTISIDFRQVKKEEITNLYKLEGYNILSQPPQYATYINGRLYSIHRHGDEYKLFDCSGFGAGFGVGLDLTKQKDRLLRNMMDWNSIAVSGNLSDIGILFAGSGTIK